MRHGPKKNGNDDYFSLEQKTQKNWNEIEVLEGPQENNNERESDYEYRTNFTSSHCRGFELR